MDVPQEELQYLNIPQILKEAVSIPRFSTRTFSLITLTLIFPLSLAILVNSLFTHPLVESPHFDPRGVRLLLLYEFLYLLFLFLFSLLSTAAVVFTVASLYTSKPTSFSSTLHAIPPVFRRLFFTFLYISFLMFLYNFAFIFSLVTLVLLVGDERQVVLFACLFTVLFIVFLAVHIYITALWHLASVITVLESVQGWAAMRKSRELLKGKTRDAAVLVFLYFVICSIIGGFFGSVVVKGRGEYGLFVRLMVAGVLLGLSVVVNLVGLLVQSVFYYVCKSYHNQAIDKTALHDHLGGYLGEYVPLKSSIQMENLVV
ncbi:uncharacterized protein [Aristolochia californica]|uniref:uncharacterized protein n=1 Tax=Aristolochia californica TaxID=171875 RepID=UPI0035DA5A47